MNYFYGFIILIAACLVIWVILLVSKRSRFNAMIAKMREDILSEHGSVKFETSMVEELPEPAARLILHAIKPGTVLAKSAVIQIDGGFKIDTDKKPLPMYSTLNISVPKGLVWDTSIGSGFMSIKGTDYYYEGEGGQNIRLWDLFPIVSTGGPDISKSAAGRVASESTLLPSALLPLNGTKWIPEHENSATAVIDVHGEEVKIRFTVDAEGSLVEVSVQRWSDQGQPGKFEYMEFRVTDFSHEVEYGGYTIPTRFNAGWNLEETGYKPFFLAEISNAEYR